MSTKPETQGERAEFCWLVELFYTNGNSVGLYLTSLPKPNHQTPDVHKAWKLTTKENAERQARKATALAGTEWRAVEHGFHTGRFSTEEEGEAYMHGWFEGQAALLDADGKAGGEVVAWLYTLIGRSGEVANREASTVNWDERYQPFGRPGIDFHEDGVVRKEPLYTRPQPAAQVAQPLTPDQLADRCESWLHSAIPITNVVDAFESGFRDAEAAHGIGKDHA